MSLTKLEAKVVQKRLENFATDYNKPVAEASIKRLYKLLGLGEPEILWLPSPAACAKDKRMRKAKSFERYPKVRGIARLHRANILQDTVQFRKAELRPTVIRAIWETERGALSRHVLNEAVQRGDQYRSLIVAVVAKELKYITKPLVALERIEAWEHVLRSTYIAFLKKGYVAVSDPPTHEKKDAEGRFHCADGPAITFADGTKLFFWHGVCLRKEYIFKNPGYLNPNKIVDEENAEVRRAMMEIYGVDEFLAAAPESRRINRGRLGELWEIRVGPKVPPWRNRRSLGGGGLQRIEFVRLVQVKNSTPEPDGLHKFYVLQVPPWCSTANQAVAWTFGFSDWRKYIQQLEQET